MFRNHNSVLAAFQPRPQLCMHSISHSFAHRGPSASRARTRWQPYSSALNPTTTSQTRSPQPYLHTPSSSILSASPTSYISPIWHLDQLRKNPSSVSIPPPQPSQANTLRDAQKNKHVTRLVGESITPTPIGPLSRQSAQRS